MRKILLSSALLASAIVANAAAPAPGTLSYTQPDGSTLQVTLEGNEYGCIYRNAATGEAMLPDAQGRLSNASSAQVLQVKQDIKAAQEKMQSRGTGLHASYVPHTGSPRVCVILVQFSDVKFVTANPQTYFNNFLNQEGFNTNGNSGSVRDYFKAQSSGKYTPQFDVYGPVTLNKKRSEYSSTANNAYKMVHEGCAALDSQVDFSIYDIDGDGNVDNVYVIFAGQGGNFGASNAPWAHNSECPTGLTTRKSVDGKILNHYSCVGECGYYTDQPDGIGTFIHEFGHALGLPDLYNTETQGNDTPVFWSIMDRGSYLGYCKTPIGYSAYERHAMDWLEYTDLSTAATVRLRSLSDFNFAVKIETGRAGDFYILENRTATGFDSGIYGAGMLIWHIDTSDNSLLTTKPNNDSNHLRVDLIRADNSNSSDSYWGDAFPGNTNNTSFTSSSTPAMKRWNASSGSGMTAVNKPVTNIVKDGNLITFDFFGGSSENIVDPSYNSNFRTITVEAGEGGKAYIGSTATTTTSSVELGSSVTLNAVASDGYVFESWKRNGSVVSTSANYTFTVSETSAGTYVATFAQVSATGLTIKVEATEGGTACIKGNTGVTSFTGEAGTYVYITASNKSGYNFDGWYFNDQFYSKYATVEFYLSATNAGTYVAKFSPETKSNYAHVTGDSEYAGSTRGVVTFTVSDNNGNTLTVNGPGSEHGHPIYVDRTDNILTVQPGAVLTFTGTAVNTAWMHSYIYIDFNNNYVFDVDADNTEVHKDLVAHTGYSLVMKSNNSDTADPTMKSDGSSVNHDNYFEIPAVTLPQDMAEGVYRLRYKNDWNNNHPYGRTAYTLTGGQVENYITTNGGSIIDLLIRVEALAGIDEIGSDNASEPAQYFNLMGLPVSADNLTPGIYIVRRGNQTTKTLVR